MKKETIPFQKSTLPKGTTEGKVVELERKRFFFVDEVVQLGNDYVVTFIKLSKNPIKRLWQKIKLKHFQS